MKQLLGIHHVTAITSDAKKNYAFFTKVLGLRLVKKTVNQDDVFTYHLFFADDKGNAGTDITFFDFKEIGKARFGANEISRTGFRVPNDKALNYYKLRFDVYDVQYDEVVTIFGRKMMFFTDFDGARYALVSDENNQGVASGTPWLRGPVPNDVAITGLGPLWLTVNDPPRMEKALSGVLGMRKGESEGALTKYEMGEGGNGAMVIVEFVEHGDIARQGYGSVHHVAFRTSDKDHLMSWVPVFNQALAPHSGFVDRFYFKSLYTRLYPNILFELATDGPGFMDDEEGYDTLGERLALPPHLRAKRDTIEKVITPLDTTIYRDNPKEDEEYLNATKNR